MRSKFKWIFTLLVALSMQFSFAQEKTVTGVVSDNNGPLPGANVVVKGTAKGVQTDVDGKYAIKAKAGDVLVVSFSGYENKNVTVGASNSVNVKLSEGAKLIDEVVVTTGLGVKKKEKAVTSSTQSLKGTAISEARESNLVNALSGKIAGVQITNSSGATGSSSRIVLRGVSSLSGSNDPLFIVDGVPFDNTSNGNADSGGGVDLPNGVASINPDDIENISVLKGPTAAALYGIRASKGVVIITTKSGKKGKTEVSFNTNTTFSNPLVLPSFQNSYGQSGSTSNFFQYTDGGLTDVAADGTDESWGAPLDVGLEFVQWDSYKVGGAPLPWVSHPDNVKDFYETGVTISNSLSIAGGSDIASFRFSAGNSDEKGMMPFTNFKKFNVMGNGTLKIGKKLTGGLSIGYFNDRSDNLTVGGYDGENAAQQFIWSARNVNFRDLKDWRNLPLNPNGTPINWNNNYQNNPYWLLENNTNTFEKNRVNGAINLGFDLTSNLKWTAKISIDNYDENTENRQAVGSNSNLNGSFTAQSRTYKEINSEMFLGYTTKLTKDVGLNLNVGANSLSRTQKRIFGQIVALQIPGFYNLSNNLTGSTPVYGNRLFEQKINSVIGFGQLSYKDYFFIDFTARNDWASILPKSNNSFFYPSVAASLVVSDIIDTKSAGIDLLKIRGGWAKVGGVGSIGPYSINSTYSLEQNGWGVQGTIPSSIFNPLAEPEQTIGTEFGIDLKAFKNRLRFSGTYYNSDSTNLLLALQISRTTGYTSKISNDAAINNKGYEITLGSTVLKAKDFSFDIDLNFAKNQNEVVTLGEVDSQLVSTNAFGLQVQNRPGHAFGDLVGIGFIRDDAGNVVYENGLPKIDSGNQRVLGNVTPDWTGGANFAVKYKGFDLSTLIDVKMGGDVYSQSYTWGRTAGTLEETLVGRETGIVGNGVMNVGTAAVPVYVPNDVVVSARDFNQSSYNQNVHESSIFDASYVKLRQVSLGYTFPKKWLNGTFIQDFKVSLVGRNLAILYKKVPHIDPETGFSSSNGNQGQEFGQIPSARNLGFNLNLKF